MMTTIKTILPLIFLTFFISSCGDEMKETEKEMEKEIYSPEKSWSETAKFKDGRVWNYSYTEELSGATFNDDFYFDGHIDSLETDISTEDEPLEEGKTYIFPNSKENSFVNKVTWERNINFGEARYRSISGMLTVSKVNYQESSFSTEGFAYIDGSYEAIVVYSTDTVELSGSFKDVFINL